jgi:chorismate mutase
MSDYNIKLKELRNKIDVIDTEICDALLKRFNVTEEIGRLKAVYSVEEMSTLRQTEILARLSSRPDVSLSRANTLAQIYEVIFKASILSQQIILLQNQKDNER